MESFSARRPCRFCMGISDDFQEKVTLFNPFLPRTAFINFYYLHNGHTIDE